MTTFIRGRGHFEGDIVYDATKVEALAADLKRIMGGDFPNASELQSAPLIDNYRLGTRQRPCLLGSVTGHDFLGANDMYTSELWVLAEPYGWARTLTRFYRLGRKAGAR